MQNFKLKLIVLGTFLLVFLSYFTQVRLTSEYWITDITRRREVEYEETIEFQKKYNLGRIILNVDRILIEFYDLNNNLRLEKAEVYINDENIGTIEINKNINNLEITGERYVEDKKLLQKEYLIGKKIRKIFGSSNRKYKIGYSGISRDFRIDIYIKDVDTNEIYIIKRDVEIEFEKRGINMFLYFPF